jgi:photosystem II stability/assembly factor-like uncharacterized protein
MKKIYILAASLVLSSGLSAQPWLPATGKPQKLEDIVERYKSEPRSFESEEEDEDLPKNGKAEKEGKDYHFDRWVWYWQQHLDKDGYMVSPLKAYNNWTDFLKTTRDPRVSSKTTNASQWTPNGPTFSPGEYSGLGRINVVTFHPADTNTYIVGTAGGGAWRTTNAGFTWTSLYDFLPVLGVSDIVYNPVNPNSIFLCTGDRDGSDTYSIGLLKSVDGGATWDSTGLQFEVTDFVLVRNLAMNPLDTNSMMVATTQGVKKTLDGGTTWTNVLPGDFRQVIYNTADTNIVYAAGEGTSVASNIYRSTDGGQNWQVVTSLGTSRAIRMAVTSADPSIVKFVAAKSDYGLLGIYNSTDSGASFAKIYGNANDCSLNILSGSNDLDNTTCSGQSWYDLCMAISPTDPNTVVVGGVNTYYSSTGGASWTIATQWWSQLPGVKTVHADKHYLVYHPLQPNLLFECNDGGIYRTASPTSTIWEHLTNGMGITQFYRNAVADNASFVLGGAQDNGTKLLSTTSTQASDQTGGDGMDCHIDFDDPATYYTSSQYGSFSRTTTGGSTFDNISDNVPGNPSGEWVTPFQINPLYHTFVLVGYDHLYLSADKGSNWTDISPGSSGSNIRRIAMSLVDAETVYTLKGATTIRHTADLGTNWNLIQVPYPNDYITDIQVDPQVPDHLWVTFGGYTGNKVADYTPSGGWHLHNQGLPDLPITCMAIDSSNGTMYIGTSVSVFYKEPSMSSWALYNTDLPVVQVNDLGINYTTNEIWAATFGRGMWRSPKVMTVPNAIPAMPLALDVISISPNPSTGQFYVNTSNTALLDQKVELNIIGAAGNVAWKGQSRFEGGHMPVNATQLSKGSYILEVNRNGVLFARTKIVIY